MGKVLNMLLLALVIIFQEVHSSAPTVVKLTGEDALEENYQTQTILDILEHQKKQDQKLERLEKENDELRHHVQTLQRKVESLEGDANIKTSRMATMADFTARPNVDITYTPGTIIQFGEALTNTGGFFNPDTGIFTCPVDGLYYFFITIYTEYNVGIRAAIYLDGNRMVDILSASADGIHGVTSLVTECNMFQGIWVECVDDAGTIRGNRFTSFSGFLLAEYAN